MIDGAAHMQMKEENAHEGCLDRPIHIKTVFGVSVPRIRLSSKRFQQNVAPKRCQQNVVPKRFHGRTFF